MLRRGERKVESRRREELIWKVLLDPTMRTRERRRLVVWFVEVFRRRGSWRWFEREEFLLGWIVRPPLGATTTVRS